MKIKIDKQGHDGRVLQLSRRNLISTALTVFLLLASATFSTQSLQAQISSATLSGTVEDSSGAVIPGATVTAIEVSSNTQRSAQTNGSGLYTIPLLQPGVYTIKVTKQGFQTAEQTNIELQVNQSASLTFKLTVGSAATTVHVSGSAPLLETQNASLGTVIGSHEIVDLPLNGRQFTQLLQLVPGTVAVDVSQNSGAAPNLGGGGVTPAVNGQSNRSDLFYLDGIYASDPFFSGYSISPSIDAIHEFQEQSHADQSESGMTLGGVINVQTKSGTNKFHGDAFEFFRNDALDALNYFQTKKGGYHLNEFGGTIGGPIIPNKLFFFGLYDGYRQSAASTNFSTLPTSAELQGDFSAILPNTIIYNPATYDPATNTAQPFPGNIIPSGDLNQGVIAVLKAYLPSSLPTSPTGNNYVNTESHTITQNQYGGRIDYNVNSNNLVFGRITINDETQVSPNQLPGNSFDTGFNGANGGVNWIHTFSPTLVSQLTFGLNSINIPQEMVQANAASVFNAGGFSAGFTDQPGGIKVSKVPGLHPSGFFDLNSGWGPIGPQHTWQISGSINKQLARHSLKFGASGYINSMYTNWAEDDINFNQQATWDPATRSGGNSLASMFLGLPVSAGRQLGNSGVNLRSHLLGVFAQDSWKVFPNLTINYGVRWNYTSPVTDTNNRLSGFDYRTGKWYMVKGDVDIPSGPLPPDVVILPRSSITKPIYDNVAPRFGFAWAPFAKTVVRAGAGIFYDSWSGALQAAQNARGAWPSGASQSVNNLDTAGVTPNVSAQNPFVGFSTKVPATPFPSGGGFLDTNFKDAYAGEWNLQIQQQLGRSGVLSLAYVGSSTSRAPIQVPHNISTQLGPTQVLPHSNMSSFNVIQSIGHMNYNAFQAKYHKRFQGGLSVITAFTWSKTINVGCAEFWEDCNIQDPYNLAADRSVSDTDVPLVFTFSGVYQLPFGKGKTYLQHGIASALAGGWQINGILATRSGTPFTVGINFDNANANGGSQRPNQVGNPNSAPHNVKEWFNTSAFAVPAQYTYGNVHRNSLRGPAYTDLDFSLLRNFDLPRSTTLQFRSEFFNILNHPNFGNPDSTLEDSTFGQITGTAGNPREIQFAAKVKF
jgi:hypothetical protein